MKSENVVFENLKSLKTLASTHNKTSLNNEVPYDNFSYVELITKNLQM